MLSLLIILICGAILVVSTRVLVDQSQIFAKVLGISPLFIALTVVAFGTSLPELVVSALALINGDSSLATANIIGSNITNASLVLGCAITIHQLKINAPKAQINAWFLLLITAIFMIIQFASLRNSTAGTMLISAGIAITLYGYYDTVSSKTPKSKKAAMFGNVNLFDKAPNGSLRKAVISIFISIVAMAISGNFLVSSVGALSIQFGISTGLIGLTLTSLVTSLPEILTTIMAQQKHDASLALGNILGSNIYNLAFIGGILTLRQTRNGMHLQEIVFLIFTSLFVFAVIKYWQNKKVPKIIGVYAILIYVVYLLTLTLLN